MIENRELATFKKPGDVERFTKEEYEERIKEIARCKRDIVYFCEHYFRITNLDKGLHLVKLYDIQKEFIQYLVDNNRIVCVSGRQQGKCLLDKTNITIRNKHFKWLKITISIGIFFKIVKMSNFIKRFFMKILHPLSNLSSNHDNK